MTPLLFIRRWLLAAAVASSLAGCSFHSAPPAFTASGYVADQGVMRLWRKDDDQQRPLVLMSVYSPYRGAGTVTTLYEYQNGTLRQIRRSGPVQGQDNLQVRFAEDGTVSFMQRQLAERREQLSSDDIALYQYQARRMQEVSDALRAGNVRLLQGHWHGGMVQTCSGQQLRPGFDEQALDWIARRERSGQSLSLAWLEAPEGRQLLLVANDDFCRWAPTKDTL